MATPAGISGLLSTGMSGRFELEQVAIFTGIRTQDLADISYKTFTNAVAEIKNKLDLRTFSDFTKLAINFGLISSEEAKKNR